MTSEIVTFIQKNLIKITNHSVSKKYIEKCFNPLIKFINNNNSNRFLLSGSQGIGKTTILQIIEKVFQKYFNKKILSLSLDDFYLDKKERIQLSHSIHPLLITRGVPGTHDLHCLQKIISKFYKSQYPIKIPQFEKLSDSRKKTKKIFKKKCDILILEGWCVGCPPIDQDYLYSNINHLEKNFDGDNKWRYFYNNNLKDNYAKLFSKFDSIIYLKPPSFSCILKWRIKQENYLKKINIKKSFKGMSNKDIKYFVQHYEKITKWMKKVLLEKADLNILVEKNQNIKKIIFN